MQHERIAEEWDEIAEARHQQIVGGLDLSYHKVLVPTLLKLLGSVSKRRIVDAGCGSGVICNKLWQLGASPEGVDPSDRMINIARREYGRDEKIPFYNDTIEHFSKAYRGRRFDACVSNMSLVTIKNLRGAMKAVSSLLVQRGIFAFTITHPWFWNKYRKYEPEKSFNYMTEHQQKGKFRISLDTKIKAQTTHFHRPLWVYFDALREASLVIETLVEPMPKARDMKLYPNPWQFPRFLAFKALHCS